MISANRVPLAVTWEHPRQRLPVGNAQRHSSRVNGDAESWSLSYVTIRIRSNTRSHRPDPHDQSFIFLASEGPTTTHPLPTVDAAIELHIIPPDSKCRATRKCAPIDPNQTWVNQVAVLILGSTQPPRWPRSSVIQSLIKLYPARTQTTSGQWEALRFCAMTALTLLRFTENS